MERKEKSKIYGSIEEQMKFLKLIKGKHLNLFFEIRNSISTEIKVGRFIRSLINDYLYDINYDKNAELEINQYIDEIFWFKLYHAEAERLKIEINLADNFVKNAFILYKENESDFDDIAIFDISLISLDYYNSVGLNFFFSKYYTKRLNFLSKKELELLNSFKRSQT
ncbi:hypothetical protein JF73_17610 (plasmid) [Lactobacillus helsingborgensis]|uniref:Uncharacterized protein n=2 Tax=Lactobacillus TaxID=1578 RepID=A0AA47B5Q4_9LACO|nr:MULTISPECIES: hypothetical protein [Lactobacillus]KJY54746.1 hypothetical protein JF74_19270 [Lactobacillus melliventris]KJY60583.1 hypothetical protein JF73_17610 [Lactobacillus helsingborgensis]UZX30628.1 hypothetical protein LDX53_09080 [Lactobacillus helsingborgensis]UZX32441.1 hypothetical protein LDX52_09120 [Lactobacillus helsingborgensis]